MTTTTNISELKKTGAMQAKQAGMGNVKKFFEASRGSMLAVLPKHVSPDRMLSLALGALRANPQLMECTTESLMSAVIVSSQLGLEPNTPLGHAYLIPFKNTRTGHTDVQFIPGYRGLIDLARRSGQIITIASHAVHEHDEFDYCYGLDERLDHKPLLGNRGSIIAFYAVAKLKDGGHAFEVMSVDQVQTIRDNSQGYKAALRYAKRDQGGNITYLNHPWHNHFVEMGRKTLIRRIFKYLPISIELASAVRLDEMHEDGQAQHMETALDGEFSIVPDDYHDESSTASADMPPSPADTPPVDSAPQTHAPDAQEPRVSVSTILSGIAASKTPDDLAECEDLINDYDGRSTDGRKLRAVLKAKTLELRLSNDSGIEITEQNNVSVDEVPL